jgi:hypothetical protein
MASRQIGMAGPRRTMRLSETPQHPGAGHQHRTTAWAGIFMTHRVSNWTARAPLRRIPPQSVVSEGHSSPMRIGHLLVLLCIPNTR